jgi:hypothetical protein
VNGNYSYDDMPPGKTDPTLRISPSTTTGAHIIALPRQARRINPHLAVMATPWNLARIQGTGGGKAVVRECVRDRWFGSARRPREVP